VKTILFSTDSLRRGGQERQLTLLGSRLIERGYNVYVAVKRIDFNNNYFTEYKLPDKNLFIYNDFIHFSKIVKKLCPDIAVSWDIMSSAYHLITYRIYKYSFINGSIRQGIRYFRLSHYIRTLLVWFSPFVMANTHTGLRINNLKAGENRFVLLNGVDNKFKKQKTSDEKIYLLNKLFTTYNNHPAHVFISVANFTPFKDYFTVLKSLHKLQDKKNFFYLIIGDGPLKPEIIKAINELGLHKNVKLLGLVNNVEDYLAVSDYYIHSSRGEGMSNAILEAMYAGLPIIATDVGGVPETVFKESSVLFPYNDDEKLYEILLHVEDLFKSFDSSSENYQKYLDIFSVESMISNFEQIIKIVSKKN
jgi:glycosyltransferase involved in cell wall biosynthesis